MTANRNTPSGENTADALLAEGRTLVAMNRTDMTPEQQRRLDEVYEVLQQLLYCENCRDGIYDDCKVARTPHRWRSGAAKHGPCCPMVGFPTLREEARARV